MDKQHTVMTWGKKAIGYIIYPSAFKDTNGDGIGDGVLRHRLPGSACLDGLIAWAAAGCLHAD